MISSTVKVFDRFPEVTAAVDRLAEDAVQEAAEEAASVAKQIGAARGLTHIEVIDARGGIQGHESGIRGRWYYPFHSYGTLGNAIRAKRPGKKRARTPGTGIKPNRMFQLARAAGRRRMAERIRRGF